MAKSGRRKPIKLRKLKPRKLEVMVHRKKEFSDEWGEQFVTVAWSLECKRNTRSNRRNLYGDFGDKEAEGEIE